MCSKINIYRLHWSLTIAFILLSFSLSGAQSLQLSVSGNHFLHLESPRHESDPAYTIDGPGKPSVYEYYDNNTGYGFGLRYNFASDSEYRYMIGLCYEHSRLDAMVGDVLAYDVGEELDIDTYAVYFGYGMTFGRNAHLIYVFAGPALKYYEGVTRNNETEAYYSYKPGLAFRAGLGIDLGNARLQNFSFGAMAFLEIGSVDLDDIRYDLYSTDAARKPASYTTLYDPGFGVILRVSYALPL